MQTKAFFFFGRAYIKYSCRWILKIHFEIFILQQINVTGNKTIHGWRKKKKSLTPKQVI